MSNSTSRLRHDVSVTQTLETTPEILAHDSRAPRVELVEGSGSGLSSETRGLLATRLRAAAIILCLGFSVFLVQRFFLRPAALPFEEKRYLDVFHVAIVLMLAIESLLICVRCPGTMKYLRWAEMIIFGLPGVYFLLMQYEGIKTATVAGNPTQAAIVVLLTVIFWNCLIFTYAMYIPNQWRRATAMIGTMAIMPVAMCIFQKWQNPLVSDVIDMYLLVEIALIMLVSGSAAIYGTHKINYLRREAFEAKQLGHYRLKRLLGSGGMGEVYLGEHQLLKRPCAIKVIRPGRTNDPNVLARFEREVQATAHLTHWNTVEIFDYGRTEDGTFFYVMEYLPGLALAELVKGHGPLPASRAIHLLRQACDALHEAHAANLVHRDIKPGNIFISQRGGIHDVVKLLDFGLVKAVSGDESVELTQDGAITGSPLYMAPEQAMDTRKPDGRSDIYALGAVAYFMLTGRPPFEGEKAIQIIFAHANEEVVPPSRLNPQVPEDLEQVVLRCLEKKPEDRFANVEQLGKALRACENGRPWDSDLAAQWWREFDADFVHEVAGVA